MIQTALFSNHGVVAPTGPKLLRNSKIRPKNRKVAQVMRSRSQTPEVA